MIDNIKDNLIVKAGQLTSGIFFSPEMFHNTDPWWAEVLSEMESPMTKAFEKPRNRKQYSAHGTTDHKGKVLMEKYVFMPITIPEQV